MFLYQVNLLIGQRAYHFIFSNILFVRRVGKIVNKLLFFPQPVLRPASSRTISEAQNVLHRNDQPLQAIDNSDRVCGSSPTRYNVGRGHTLHL